MNDVHEEAQRQLNAVRRDFEVRLGDMIEDIVCAWEAARSAPDLARLRKLTELLHSLSGNAGFFRLQEVSGTASALEQMVDRWVDSGTINKVAIIEMNRLMQILRACAAPCDGKGKGR